MLASKAAASTKALEQLVNTFRSEGLPLLGVKGHDVPLRHFDVEHSILQYAAANECAPLCLGPACTPAQALNLDKAPTASAVGRTPLRTSCYASAQCACRRLRVALLQRAPGAWWCPTLVSSACLCAGQEVLAAALRKQLGFFLSAGEADDEESPRHVRLASLHRLGRA